MTITVMDSLSEIDQANVVRCARLLLRRPLLRAGGPDGDLLALVYRHRSALVELFAATLGYRLVVERRFARLYKAGPGADPTRSDAALSPRGYAYLALSLAVLTGVGYQVLLSRLVADIRGAAESAGIVVRDDLAERRSLAAALRHLIAVGVIVETDGSVAGLLGDASAEALITVDTALLGQLPIGPIAEADTPLRLIALAQRPGPRGVEHAVRRRLVENPVTHYADLPEEQAAWLRRRGRRESELLERYFGLQTETRAEGVAVTDPDDSLTDIVFP
ncbi:MAG: TIGR02678 family protein, partial [Sciscionella sp.]